MDSILNIVKYKGEHGRYIMKQKMNHVLMDKDMEFDGDPMNLEQDNLAFTGMIDGEPIFAKWLGLQEEGLMKKFGFDGSDQYMYARLF
jgi:hypothetical protein